MRASRSTGHRRTAAAGAIGLLLGAAALLLPAAPCPAAFTDLPTSWTNFTNNPGYFTAYTYQGAPISDFEGQSSDTSRNEPPNAPIELASGSPNQYPGAYDTPFFGYYDGGTAYDPENPATMEDDYVFFRMRIDSDPRTPGGGNDFVSYHWNILVDVDRDGYKEFWVDLFGGFQCDNKTEPCKTNGFDQLQVLYDDSNNQEIADPDAARADEFQAYDSALYNSHTRVVPTGSMSGDAGDYYIDFQIPLTAFNDLGGNQVVWPDSPVAFVFSTSNSNVDPLQKDFMMDIGFLSNADPIQFGDVVKLNGEPEIMFIDPSREEAYFYYEGGEIYTYVKDRLANASATAVETISITVTDPATGDDEVLTLVETGPNTGVFTNLGGASAPVNSTNGWVNAVTYAEESGSPGGSLQWRTRYDGANWIVESSPDGSSWTGRGTATPGTPFSHADPAGWRVDFVLYTGGAPSAGETVTFTTYPGEVLPGAAAPGADDDGTLEAYAGDTIQFSYTVTRGGATTTFTAEADIVGTCEPYLQFTRKEGTPTDNFIITNSSATSDRLFVTAFHPQANTDPATAQSISVTLGGNDTQTLTLVETGVDTGIFRNAPPGLATQIEDATPPAAGDDLWEDADGGTPTVTYAYPAYGACSSGTTAASTQVFATLGGGRVYFVNQAGNLDVELYSSGQTVYAKIVDASSCPSGSPATLGVRVSAPTGDFEDLTLAETSPGSGVFLDPSSAVTTATYDGAYAANDGTLELRDDETLTVTYADCDDGDSDPANNAKTDTAVYNSPALVINEVLFYPADECVSDPLVEPDPYALGQREYVELLNTTTADIPLGGYTLSDGDGFSFTFPTFTLPAGDRLILMLFEAGDAVDYVSGTYLADADAWYFLTTAAPTDSLGDPLDAATAEGPADQLLLTNDLGEVVDFVAWSSVPVSPSPLDNTVAFKSDDQAAVLAGEWTDDAFRDVGTASPLGAVACGSAITRAVAGRDTNRPGDWVYRTVAWDDPIFEALRLTPVLVSAFRALNAPGGVLLEWETAAEQGTIGFNLLRTDPGLPERRVNPHLLPGLTRSPQGGRYRFLDEGALPGATASYRLEEITFRGERLHYGPFAVRPRDWTEETPPGGFDRAPRNSPRAVERLAAAATAPLAGAAPEAARAPDALRVLVREEGLTRLRAAEIAAKLRLSEEEVRALIRTAGLSLSTLGRPVAWTPAPAGRAMLFHARPARSLYAAEAVYWLRRGPGTVMSTRPGMSPQQVLEPMDVAGDLHAEEDRLAMPQVVRAEGEDFWFWTEFFGGVPGWDEAELPFRIEGLADRPATAELSVDLVAAEVLGPIPVHAVLAFLNGAPLGTFSWEGRRATAAFSFPQGLLREGGNTLRLAGLAPAGAEFDYVLVDSFDLRYRRAARAAGGRLALRGEGVPVVTVGGFPDTDVLVLDLARPRAPRILEGVTVGGAPGEVRASFAPSPPGRRFLAVAASAARAPAAVLPAWSTGLRRRGNRADLVLLTPRGLRAGARELAAYRARQGLVVKIVGLQEVYDEFSHGTPDPRAIRSFLAYARRRWERKPQYALILGEGTYDARDLEGRGDCLVPPLLLATDEGLVASDTLLGDVRGADGVPEVAVGRLPVLTNEELHEVIAKIRRFEGTAGPWRRRSIWIADNPDRAGSFTADSDAVAALRPDRLAARRLPVAELGPDGVRESLFEGLAAGAAFVNYLGHAGVGQLADEGILTTADVESLPRTAAVPVVTAMTCAVGRFDLPGYDSLAEALVTRAAGGAVAVWSPSGYSVSDQARGLDAAFYGRLFRRPGQRLGDLTRGAAREFRRRTGSGLAAVYNLLGDPATRLR